MAFNQLNASFLNKNFLKTILLTPNLLLKCFWCVNTDRHASIQYFHLYDIRNVPKFRRSHLYSLVSVNKGRHFECDKLQCLHWPFHLKKDQGKFDLSLYDPFKIDAIKSFKKKAMPHGMCAYIKGSNTSDVAPNPHWNLPCCPALRETWSGICRWCCHCSLSEWRPWWPETHCDAAPGGCGTTKRHKIDSGLKGTLLSTRLKLKNCAITMPLI